jgi:HEAT repeat protein
MRQCPKCKYSLPAGRWDRCPACKYLLPARLRQETRRVGGSNPFLGIGALVAAVAGIAICWIPSLSLLSILLSVLALALAGAGLWVAHKHGDTAVGMVTAATTTGGISLLVSLGVYVFFHHIQPRRLATIQTPVALPKITEVPDSEWPDARKFAVRQGSIQVQILRLIPRRDGFGVEIQATNLSDWQGVNFHSWGSWHYPRISDDMGNEYEFNEGRGAVMKTLDPDDSFKQTLAFGPLLKTAEYLRLELPAGAFGGSGYLRVQIPNTMLTLQLAPCLGERVVPRLCELVKNPDPVLRKQACQALAEAPGDSIDPVLALAATVADRDATVRCAACEALGKLGARGRYAAASLSQAQQDSDPNVREAAAGALQATGEFTAEEVPTIRNGLKNPNAGIRLYAMNAMARVAPSEQDAFMAGLRDEAKEVRIAAANILGGLGNNVIAKHDALVELMAYVKSGDQDLAAVAVQTLHRLGPMPETEVPVLLEYLACEMVEARRYAAWALEQTPSAAAMPDLIERLADPDSEVQAGAAQALGTMGPSASEAVPALARVFSSGTVTARVAAGRALARIGEPAIPALRKLLTDANEGARSTAATVLGEMGAPANVAVPQLATLLKDSSPQVRANAAKALAKFGSQAKATVSALADRATDHDKQVRIESLRAVRAIGADGTCVGPLLSALKDSDAAVYQLAQDTLSMMRPNKTWLPALRGALGDANPRVNEYAAAALAGLGKDALDATADLCLALKNEDPVVRRSAAEALAGLAPAAGTVPALFTALDDDSGDVARAAERGLHSLAKLSANERDLISQALKSKKTRVRLFAIGLVEKMGPEAKSVARDLVLLLTDSDEAVRQQAVGVLVNVAPHSGDVAKALSDMLDNAVASRSRLAAKEHLATLGKLGPDARPAVPIMIRLLEDDNLQDDAVAALRKVGAPAMPYLIDSLDSKDIDHRITIINVLGEMGRDGATALDTLTTIANGDRFPRVRAAASAALKKLKGKRSGGA